MSVTVGSIGGRPGSAWGVGGAMRMTVSLSVSWDDSKKKRGTAALMVGLLLLVPFPRPSRAHTASAPLASVIVEALPTELAGVRHAVAQVGGTVERDLGVIGGFVAR